MEFRNRLEPSNDTNCWETILNTFFTHLLLTCAPPYTMYRHSPAMKPFLQKGNTRGGVKGYYIQCNYNNV